MLIRGRIDAVKGVTDDGLLAWLTNSGKDIILVHHILPQMEGLKWDTQEPYPDTTNPHYHFYLDTTYKSVQALAYQIKKKFTMLNKTDWSLKPCDPERREEYWQYLFNNKHGNTWRLVSTYTPMEVFIERANHVTQSFEERRKERLKTKTGYDISMELAEWIRQMDYTERDNYKPITLHAIKLHRQYKKAFCLFSLERVVITALGEVQPDKLGACVAMKLAQKFRDLNPCDYI